MWAAVLVSSLSPQWWLLIAAVMIATEFLPDPDLRVSVLEHRGYSHTVRAGLLVAMIFGVAAALFASTIAGELAAILSVELISPLRVCAVIAVGTVLGFLAHFTGDIITVGQGYYWVQPFAPLSQCESSIQLWRADSTIGNTALVGGGWIALGASVYLRWQLLGWGII